MPAAGRVTSRQLVVEYLTRIGLYEDQVKAIITVNPKALEEAEARDRERASGKIRGPVVVGPSRHRHGPS